VKESIRSIGGPAGKCVVVPYGVDSEAFIPRARASQDGPLKVLFVGTIQLRKGIQYLMGAARILKDKSVKIRAVGTARVSSEAIEQISGVIDLAGAVPRSGLRSEYDWADVLVVPSISEGSANVCYEALASGLPIITTPNAGSVVRDGIEGFIVPIRSAEAIAGKLGMLASDRALIGRLSTNAIQRAADYTRQKYGERLISAITHEQAS
jgi:glycosyltransferase involved in cell wall biosynthesis